MVRRARPRDDPAVHVGGERGQTTVEWLAVMVAVAALAGALLAALPPVASAVTSTFERVICRVGGGACPGSAAPAPAPAPAPGPAPGSPLPARAAGARPTYAKRSCSKGGRTATFQVQMQRKRDPDTGKVFNVITGVTYRLRGARPGKVKLWVFQRAIQTYTDTGKRPGGEVPGPGELNGAEVGIAVQGLVRDGRAHTLDIGQWSAKDAPVGTYVQPQTNGIFQIHYDYVFVVDPGNDSGGCSFHFDG
jgi:hypothetical protein